MNKEFGKVAVLMGGNSAEREVSLKSGQAVLAALIRRGVDAVGIDAKQPLIAQLTATRFDRVFIALHGRGGEDGVVQGLLESLNLPYSGSGVLGSALAMDKRRTKQIWQGNHLPTPPFTILRQQSDLAQVASVVGFPMMLKPALEGSSIGITKVNQLEELESAWQISAQFNCEVIAERFVKGKEYTAAILQETALPLIRLETPRTFYDYTAKYTDSGTAYICPCGLTPAREQVLQELAMQAFLAVGARGWGRVDFICDEQDQPWLLEVNTIPGMTDHSLVPMAAKVAGLSFDELVVRILATTL
ncbi:MAG: D-alanine--D-alanine ligase [Beggiatoa sp. IS2]|nr:MAG: D-alanine--D-alanine ligase [Beggiatoa sp. IS2]